MCSEVTDEQNERRPRRFSSGSSHKLTPPWRNLVRTGSSQADDPPAVGQNAEPAISSPFATTRLVAWHSDLVAWLDRLRRLPTLNGPPTPPLGPGRERHPGNPCP